jgi:hypothetical protein
MMDGVSGGHVSVLSRGETVSLSEGFRRSWSYSTDSTICLRVRLSHHTNTATTQGIVLGLAVMEGEPSAEKVHSCRQETN